MLPRYLVLLLTLLPLTALAGTPECLGWPSTMAFVHLKNAGLTDNDKLDHSKTKTVRVASEQIGADLYRQVHRVTFTDKSGTVIEVITVSDASNMECSMGAVEVYVVSTKLGG